MGDSWSSLRSLCPTASPKKPRWRGRAVQKAPPSSGGVRWCLAVPVVSVGVGGARRSLFRAARPVQWGCRQQMAVALLPSAPELRAEEMPDASRCGAGSGRQGRAQPRVLSRRLPAAGAVGGDGAASSEPGGLEGVWEPPAVLRRFGLLDAHLWWQSSPHGGSDRLSKPSLYTWPAHELLLGLLRLPQCPARADSLCTRCCRRLCGSSEVPMTSAVRLTVGSVSPQRL